MAQPLVPQQDEVIPRPRPRTVVSAKEVSLVLVRYADDTGQVFTQFAAVGDNTVHMLDGKAMCVNRVSTPQGPANEWLKNGVFAKLKEKK